MPAAFSGETGELPQLTDFTFHKTPHEVDLDCHRRPALSLGVYRFEGPGPGAGR